MKSKNGSPNGLIFDSGSTCRTLHATVLRACHGEWPPSEIGDQRQTGINYVGETLSGALNLRSRCYLPISHHITPSPQLSCRMLEGLTLDALFFAGFLVVVSLFLSGYFNLMGDPGVRRFPSYFNAVPKQCCIFQLNAIPTAGFSDPILSYFSAAQFTFDGIRMLKEGYEKVICLSLMGPFSIELTMLLRLDKTGSI